MPRILHIETSGKTCSVAISKADSLTDYHTISEDKSHARHLTMMIQKLLADNKLSVPELDAVAVSAGPGSYTGLRIGVSVAKGICYAASLPLIAVPTLKIMLKNLFTSCDKTSDFDLFVPMIDARRMEVYQASYTSDAKKISDVSPLILDENAYRDQLEKHQIVFFGNGAEKAEKVITHPHAFFIPGVMPDARYMISGALNRFRHKNFEDVAYYEPFYLKAFQATTPKNLLF
ncbi:MAG: tRNA (adenosine(37)-N6)-threonylcarbamoyltransferase complex dimerization subunit type 1 TsaB [Bacteroidota bacterium]|nr:tRNA (adenosine(37)-N6)-threonylcarbamoyltransferase complex dimerization subunit type 1 TsaB [Bacteroidota bacterium]